MQVQMNISEAFAQQARKRPGSAAIVFPEQTLTYRQLHRLFVAFALRLSASGVGATSTLMLHSGDLQVILATLLAASHLGAAVVPSSDEIPLPAGLSITHHFHDEFAEKLPTADSILIDTAWSPANNPGDLPPSLKHDGEKPWLYLHTSGTTGIPKFIALSQRMIYLRSMAVADEFIGEKTRFASLMPVNSRTFLARAFAVLLNGATIVDGRDPGFWISSGVTMVSASPTQMKRFTAATVLQPRLPLAEVMGSRLSRLDVRRLLRSFETIQDVFGAAEASKVFANVSTLDKNGEVQTKGQMRDTLIEIVDVDGNPVAAGQDGILRLRNEYLVNGYLNDSATERFAFRNGWFYPGDVAAWGPNGTLDIRDRMDHIVNIGGVKINAFAVDQLFKSTHGIRDAICFKNPKEAGTDELFIFVVFADGCNRLQAVESARFRCREILGEAMVPRVVRGVAGIPRRLDGAPDRKACAELVLSLSRQATPTH